MLYKPNYCCHCGEKIERIEWHFWTSRRFCDACDKEFKVQERIPTIAATLGLLLSVFGVGAYLSAGGAQMPAAAVRKSSEIVRPASESLSQKTIPPPSNMQAGLPQQSMPAAVENQTKPVAQVAKTQLFQAKSEPPKEVYFCGAETKKGTPCSRRVKGGGRCFQHEGQPAMLPPEKLLASQ